MNDLVQVGRSSAAPTTVFCVEKVWMPGGKEFLWVDGNGKITNASGSYAAPKPNAFSILEVEDCPFRTPTCEAACYVQGIAAHAPDTHEMYRHNSRTIRAMLSRVGREIDIFDDVANEEFFPWAEALSEWISANCTSFRWHVSGDIFSPLYERWIATVAAGARVPQWIYTRSFPLLDWMLPIDNLTINLSADRDNYWLAKRYADRYGLRLCYMTRDGWVPDDLPEGSVIFPDYALRASKRGGPSEQRENSMWWNHLTGAQQRMMCPVDFYGASEGIRCGPCRKCL